MPYPPPLLFVALVLVLTWSCASEPPPPAHTNRLAGESSPYLRQHAHNPVDWHPWGDTALAKAKAEDKMLLVSIGYASCHWCHVMERESFSDSTVAARMNRHFVSIKVDREERPDIDQLYMTACQLATRRGCGWPLNVVALPDGRPVWAGTYYPRKAWLDVLQYFIQLHQDEPAKLEAYAGRLSEGIAASSLPRFDGPAEDAAPRALTDSLAARLLRTLDAEHGGRSGSPKFPMPPIWSYLLDYAVHTGDRGALGAVTTTLDGMAAGGIYDVLGGGFARYATDDAWQIPHFEKMLYDNAQLTSLYAKAYRKTGDPAYARVVRETLRFVARELTDEEGGFYASLDADSEGEEGKFYTWTLDEVEAALPPGPQRQLVLDYYRITEAGNWEEGKNTLRAAEALPAAAARLGLSAPEARNLLDGARERLFAARAKRPRPRRDDKRITAWNALMLSAYVEAYHALGDGEYREAALRNAAFLRERLQDGQGRLRRSFPAGQSAVDGFLEDYAFCARAFLDLYRATFDEQWIDRARELVDLADALFLDPDRGLYFFSAREQATPVTRQIPVEDNVIPSGNAVMADVLLELSHLVYPSDYRRRARAMLGAMTQRMGEVEDGAFVAQWGQVVLKDQYPRYEVAIVGPGAEAGRERMLREYLPQAVLLGGSGEGGLALLRGKGVPGKTMFYVCRERVCRLPVASAEQALAQLR